MISYRFTDDLRVTTSSGASMSWMNTDARATLCSADPVSEVDMASHFG